MPASLSHLVTAVTERPLGDFEKKEATAQLLGARSGFGTKALPIPADSPGMHRWHLSSDCKHLLVTNNQRPQYGFPDICQILTTCKTCSDRTVSNFMQAVVAKAFMNELCPKVI